MFDYSADLLILMRGNTPVSFIICQFLFYISKAILHSSRARVQKYVL